MSFELLEDRVVPTTFVVTNTNDAGLGSLREAIIAANADMTSDHRIEFNIPIADPNFVDVDNSLAGGDAAADAFVIQPLSLLPSLNNPSFFITLDATTQTTATGDTNPFGPEIVLDGSMAGPSEGIIIQSSFNSVIGLNIQQFTSSAVRIDTGGDNILFGNYIGTDATGTMDRGNTIEGVLVLNSAGNFIGGGGTGEGNVISGNDGTGIIIRGAASTGNLMLGNRVGTNATGTVALGNSLQGIVIENGAGNAIGSSLSGAGVFENGGNGAVGVSATVPGEGNVISGNGANGIVIVGTGADGNIVQGNLIGTDVTGTQDLGNGFSGLFIGDGAALAPPVAGFATNTTIGGTSAAESNVISGNDAFGIVLVGSGSTGNQVLGNFIGTDVNGTASLGNILGGVIINDSPNNTIGGSAGDDGNVISGNGDDGVAIIAANATGNLVAGNFIGTDVSGSTDLGNTRNGLSVFSGTAANTIGGLTAGARNVVSGNDNDGIAISDSGTAGNVVVGNYVGTNVTGTADLGNTRNGISIFNGTTNNTIGGSTAAARNIVSGNDNDGVAISDSGTTGNVVAGNFIGTDVNGTIDLGNARNGFAVFSGATGNMIGGINAGEGNVIAFNAGIGIVVTDATTTGNRITQNSIHSNGGLGIDLSAGAAADGATPNDVMDPDPGANNLQNFPVVTSVVNVGGNTTIDGTLNSVPNTMFSIELFSNPTQDPSGFDEGQTFLTSVMVMTNGSGDTTFSAMVPGVIAAGSVTATATHLGTFDTSEFSLPLGVPDILLTAFSADSTAPDQLSLTYEILGGSVGSFEIGIFESSDSVFDGADVETGPRILVSNPADLTIGTHTLTVAGSPYASLLADLDRPFVLAAADVADAVTEADETNNVQSFAGAFLSAADGVLMVRGTDSADTISLVPSDSFVVASTSFAGSFTTPVSGVSQVRVLALGGDDAILADELFGPPISMRGGDGNDTLQSGAGNDSMDGGAGDDRYVLLNEWGSDQLTESAGGGSDTIDLTAIESALTAQFGFSDPPEDAVADLAFDTDFFEFLLLGSSDDVVEFGDASSFGSGSGMLDGGPGFDTLDFTRFTSPVFVDLDGGTADGTGGVQNFEQVLGDTVIIGASSGSAEVMTRNAFLQTSSTSTGESTADASDERRHAAGTNEADTGGHSLLDDDSTRNSP